MRSEIGLYESLAGTSRQTQESTVLSFCACFLQEIDFWYKQAGTTFLEAQAQAPAPACENDHPLRFRLRFQRSGYYFKAHGPGIRRVCCRQVIAQTRHWEPYSHHKDIVNSCVHPRCSQFGRPPFAQSNSKRRRGSKVTRVNRLPLPRSRRPGEFRQFADLPQIAHLLEPNAIQSPQPPPARCGKRH